MVNFMFHLLYLSRVESQTGCGGEKSTPSHSGNQTQVAQPTISHFIDWPILAPDTHTFMAVITGNDQKKFLNDN
jgi:hypothetical protein